MSQGEAKKEVRLQYFFDDLTILSLNPPHFDVHALRIKNWQRLSTAHRQVGLVHNSNTLDTLSAEET